MVSGPDAGTAEGSETLPGKALPPWLLRQGITSTSSARGGQAGTPLLQAGVGASGGAVTSGEAILSEEEDQKRIEVCCFTLDLIGVGGYLRQHNDELLTQTTLKLTKVGVVFITVVSEVTMFHTGTD